eukprot:25095-Pelagococcus_subviridis.AAC.1
MAPRGRGEPGDAREPRARRRRQIGEAPTRAECGRGRAPGRRRRRRRRRLDDGRRGVRPRGSRRRERSDRRRASARDARYHRVAAAVLRRGR